MLRIRLMTSNIWGDYFGNPVQGRDRLLSMVYLRYAPDILGVQEMTPNWWKSELCRQLAVQFRVIAADTQGKTNYTPLFYNPARLELLQCGWELYDELRDPSKGFTYGVFCVPEKQLGFAVFCTHFWWKKGPEHEAIRVENAQILIHYMRNIQKKYSCPVFFCGDLNCTCDSLPWELLKSYGWETAFKQTANHSPRNSWHGDPIYGDGILPHGTAAVGPVEDSIDHIGVPKGISVVKQRLVDDQDALDATDHSPIYIDVDINSRIMKKAQFQKSC